MSAFDTRLKHLHSGKVRELYEVDADHLLMVASDRVSVYDVILNRGEGTLVDIREWEKASFEGVIQRHPKALIRFAG